MPEQLRTRLNGSRPRILMSATTSLDAPLDDGHCTWTFVARCRLPDAARPLARSYPHGSERAPAAARSATTPGIGAKRVRNVSVHQQSSLGRSAKAKGIRCHSATLVGPPDHCHSFRAR